MSTSRKHLLLWGAVILWSAVIFTMSSIPGSNLPGGYSWQGHLTEYAIFSALLFFAIRLDRPPLQAAILAVLIASVYGVTDEFHQSFVPLRTPDPLDWLTDTAGAAIAVGLILFGIGYRVRTKRQ